MTHQALNSSKDISKKNKVCLIFLFGALGVKLTKSNYVSDTFAYGLI